MVIRVLKKVDRTFQSLRLECEMRTARMEPVSVLIVGNPKSGTTVISMLLSKMTNMSIKTDMLFWITQHSREINVWEKMHKNEISLKDVVSRNRLYFHADILKDPDLTYFYRDALDLFSPKQSIFIARDPRDNIRSILNRLKLPGNLDSLSTIDSENFLPGWKFFLEHELPFGTINHYIDKLSHWWNNASLTYLKHQSEFTLIKYEDFLKDKVGSIRELAHNAGFEVVNDISVEVNIQYQPRGDADVDWSVFFGGNNLSKIEAICGPTMEKLGYQT